VAGQSGGGLRVTLKVGGKALDFCKTSGLWGFCGLDARYAAIKLRAARDIADVRDSVEAYSRGR